MKNIFLHHPEVKYPGTTVRPSRVEFAGITGNSPTIPVMKVA